jgi:hypothetical protein
VDVADADGHLHDDSARLLHHIAAVEAFGNVDKLEMIFPAPILFVEREWAGDPSAMTPLFP